MKYRELKKYKYQLVEDFTFCGVGFSDVSIDYIIIKGATIVIKKGYAWDGASGTAIDTKDFMKGSLVHDALYQVIRKKSLSKVYRKEADRILKRMCELAGMNKFRAWYVYQAVRIFGRFTLKKRTESEIKEI